MRPIIVATWSKEEEKGRHPQPPSPPVSPRKSSPPSVCIRRRHIANSLRVIEENKKFAGDAEEKASMEKTGREQLAQQTQLLKSINDNLTALKELAERNASTNAAVLVLLTHVLKGDTLENGDRDAASSLLSNSNQGSVEKLPVVVDSDSNLESKSLTSETADLPDKPDSNEI